MPRPRPTEPPTPRVTGGLLRNRRLAYVPSGVRPATDRVREAVCSMLASVFEGAIVLDLYAGAGMYGLEAWSRGASQVTWIDSDPAACDCIRSHVRDWGLPEAACRTVQATLPAALSGDFMASPADLVFLDPPYEESRDASLLNMTLQTLSEGANVSNSCYVLAEVPHDAESPAAEGWRPLRDRTYGKSRVVLFRREA